VVRLGVQLLDEMGTNWGNSSKYRVCWRNTDGKRQMEGLGVDRKIILKYILKKQEGRATL
jgi:hypothetical protein